MNSYREAVSTQSPGLPRLAATLGIGGMATATLTGLRFVVALDPGLPKRQPWAGGLNRFAVKNANVSSQALKCSNFDFDWPCMLLCRHFDGAKAFRVLFQSVQVPRIKAGRIGKRVRIPRGRATVNVFAKS